MTRQLWGTLGALALLVRPGAAAAADYSFEVPRMVLVVGVEPDASVDLDYAIDFRNESDGDPIDVVDVGLPHGGYDVSTMSAWLDDVACRRIAPSSYIATGVEVQLGAATIGSGRAGRFRFHARMPDMVYQDTTRSDLASLRITPTWFSGDLLRGTTDLEVSVVLPSGIAPEQVLHQGLGFTFKEVRDGHVVAGWDFPAARLDGPHMVALSFPKVVMTRVVVLSRWQLLTRWWRAAWNVRLAVGIALVVLFGVFFFRFTGRTGCVLFVAAAGALAAVFARWPLVELAAIPLLLVLGVLMEWTLRRRRADYLPPIATVEGGEIKRGLTAPEAAVLLELPLRRVLPLVLFGLLKKGFLLQTSADPLRLELDPRLAEQPVGVRNRVAAEIGSVLHPYEHPFLDALWGARGMPASEADFSDALEKLVRGTVGRVTGFDIAATRQYYRSIVEQAWSQAEALGEVEPRTRLVDRDLEWLLVANDGDKRFGHWFHSGFAYQPVWLRGTLAGGGLTGASAGGGGSSGGVGAPSFGDVSASFAGWFEGVGQQLVGSSKSAGLALHAGSSGAVSFAGLDKMAGDALAGLASREFGGGGGFHGGGGGCACAGCACACACAGGGR